jgi:hypothetical protein
MYSEELRKFYPLPNIIKNHGEFGGRDTCAHGEVKNVTTILSENLKKRVHLEELRVDGLVILKWIFKGTGCEDAE